MTTHDHAVAAGHSVGLDRWWREFDGLLGVLAPRFARVEPRRHVRSMLLGLLAGLPRTNCWTVAEHVGAPSPYAMQHLLARAVWDHDRVREDLRGYVVGHLGREDAVLVVDETGDVKKGTETVGVQRQYTGTAGRVENAQVGVYLTYATEAGHAFIDRALYLGKSWTGDPDRCARAGIPADVVFQTKPQLAGEMITRALDAGTPAGWVAGDEVYGNDPALRQLLRERGMGHVLAVSRDHRIHTGNGHQKAIEVAASLPAAGWETRSAGPGSKGQRWYEWALIHIDETPEQQTKQQTGNQAEQQPPPPGQHRLLIRRNRRTAELAFYRCWTPNPVPLPALIRVAGLRWRIEENFQAGKGLAALDQHQVRGWTSWHRWTILAMLAHAFLAVLAATEPPPTHSKTNDLIRLTCNEIRHLFISLTNHARHGAEHLLKWSRWRRRHQAIARAHHYRRHEAEMNDHDLQLPY